MTRPGRRDGTDPDRDEPDRVEDDAPAGGMRDELLVGRGGAPSTPQPVPARGLRFSVRAFRHRNYAIFWCGALVSTTGTWLQNLTVPYVLYQITGSALYVGLATVFQIVPGVLLGPVAGGTADRRDRRKVLLVTQSAMAVAALALWAAWAYGVRDPLTILALVGVGGIFHGLNLPSWQSFVNDLVPREDLRSAVTLNSVQFNAGRALGPGIAGVLLAAWGPAWAFLLNALSYVAVILALLAVRARTAHRPPSHTGGHLRLFADAVRYTGTQPGIVVALAVAVMVGMLGNPIFSFTVVFADSVFDVGPIGLGVLNVALGIGAVLAAPVVAGWDDTLTRSVVVKWGLPLHGASLIAFAVSPSMYLAVPALLLVGGTFLAVISTSNTAVQMIVADPMRGRVLALRVVVFTSAFPAGATLQGWLADLVGPQVTVTGAGVVLLLLGVGLARRRGRVRLDRLDDPHDDPPHPVRRPVAG